MQTATELLAACGGNKTEAARRAGIARQTFRDRLEKEQRLAGQASAPVARRRAAAPAVPDLATLSRDELIAMLLKQQASPAPQKRGAQQPQPEAARVWDLSRLLIIPDLHAPYQHPDALEFLAAVKDRYKPTAIFCTGDELDYHALSFHDSDPDLDSAGPEFSKGREFIHQLEQLFPVMDLVESNHGSMVYRRQKAHGIPKHMLLSYRDAVFGEHREDGSIYRPNDRGAGWRWHPSLDLSLPNGEKLHIAHGLLSNALTNCQRLGVNFVQGHHHSRFEIQYLASVHRTIWGMTAGCLIDDSSRAFAYNKTQTSRPILGCGLIEDGQPRLIHLQTNGFGRWTKRLP